MGMAFLLYDSRSGSTILSKKVSERYGSVYITPEIGFEHVFAHPHDPRNLNASFLLKKEYFTNIGLSEAEISAVLQGHTPLDGARAVVEALVGEIVKKVRHGGEAGTVIVKNGRHTLFMDEIHEAFGGDVKFIFIYRDPRAVISSKFRTIRPRNKYETMAWGGSLLAAYRWLEYSRLARRAQEAGMDVIEIKYENFMRSTSEELDRLASFLGLTPLGDVAGADNAGYEIPEEERSIHTLVMSGQMHQERIEGWRQELSPKDQILIEAMLYHEMQRRGYTPDNRMTDLRRMAIMASALPGTAFRISVHYIREIMNKLKGRR